MNKLSFYFIVRHKSTKVPENKYNDETNPECFKQRTEAYISTNILNRQTFLLPQKLRSTSNSPGRLPNYSGSTVEAELYFKDNAKKKIIVDDRFLISFYLFH